MGNKVSSLFSPIRFHLPVDLSNTHRYIKCIKFWHASVKVLRLISPYKHRSFAFNVFYPHTSWCILCLYMSSEKKGNEKRKKCSQRHDKSFNFIRLKSTTHHRSLDCRYAACHIKKLNTHTQKKSMEFNSELEWHWRKIWDRKFLWHQGKEEIFVSFMES